jgi:hypothetical protein
MSTQENMPPYIKNKFDQLDGVIAKNNQEQISIGRIKEFTGDTIFFARIIDSNDDKLIGYNIAHFDL